MAGGAYMLASLDPAATQAFADDSESGSDGDGSGDDDGGGDGDGGGGDGGGGDGVGGSNVRLLPEEKPME